jgi:hypothetical protein
LSHVKRRPTSKWNAVADLAGPDILRSVYWDFTRIPRKRRLLYTHLLT